MKTFLTAVFLFLATSLVIAQDNGARPDFLKILTYEQVQSLNSQSRNAYAQSVAKVLVELSKQKKLQKNQKISFVEQWFSLGSIAYAAPLYQCIGAGVPVDAKVNTCGVNSYAGFTCAKANESICNPLVFGVSNSGQPVCSAGATTKWCFDNTKLGTDQTLDPVFKANNVDEWNKLRAALEQACNDSSTIKESRSEVASACGYVRAQMQVNEDIRKLMAKDYTYKNQAKPKQHVEAKNDSCNGACAAAAVASRSVSARSNFQVLKEVSGFYPSSHSFARNAKEANIPGIIGELLSPMPGCSSDGPHQDNYHYRGSQFHAAQDLNAAYGTPVRSVAPGIVVTATAKGDGYGNSVVVMHKTIDGEVFYTGYHHLASIKLRRGDRIAAGNVLGAMGNTGISTGAHLHFEIMDKNQKRSNPAVYYPNGMCSRAQIQSTRLAAL